jgi:NAD(P)-dependent dehydrogenase (short-subunit alcohol dehydrogenase family)
MTLEGRHALVTGAGRGIGRLVALHLAESGCDLALASRTRTEVEAVASEVNALGRRTHAVVTDVARAEEVARLFREAKEALGSVEILVNGAGVAPSAPFAKTSESLWRAAIETNLSGVFYCMREALPEMMERGWGRIVNIASIAGKTGYPYIAAYAASKHGVLGLTKCAALEAAAHGVTVNAVCPGYVDSPMTDVSIQRLAEKTKKPPAEIRKLLEDMSPQKRLFTAQEVAAFVLFLCGEDARGITGQALSLDGGTVV